MRFVAGMIVGVVLLVAVGAFMVYGGYVAVAATTPPDMVDKVVPTARDRAIAHAAPIMSFAADEAAARRGMEHFSENCLACHGAPGVKPMEFADGMNPKPPALDSAHTQAFANGELFWVVKNGIRASGMPGFGVNHQDKEVQDIVAFVRHIPKLTDAERRDLAEALPHGHHEHHR